jgi:hypothetical protein
MANVGEFGAHLLALLFRMVASLGGFFNIVSVFIGAIMWFIGTVLETFIWIIWVTFCF